jgi:tRNA1(Val) A37 N6-methylase TrmN6
MSSSTNRRVESAAAQGAATSADDFLGGRVTLLQPLKGHRAGIEPVFLAAATSAQQGDRVLDAGAGVGVAGLCLLARVPEIEITAVEIDAGLCELAVTNAARNGVAGHFRVINADVTDPQSVLTAKGLSREDYGRIIANPPFHAAGNVRAAPDAGRASAHVMEEGGSEAWFRFFAAMAAPGATLTLIHRADALGEVLAGLERRFGDIAVFPLFAKEGEPATRILVEARKGSRAALRLLPGLVLHEPGGRYTGKAEAILRGGEALSLA